MMAQSMDEVAKKIIIYKQDLVLHNAHMDTNNTLDDASAAHKLGLAIRQARTLRGMTIAQLAEQIGRPREWLNRVELGYSEFGEIKPPSGSDLSAILSVVGENFDISDDELIELGREAETRFQSFRQSSRSHSLKSRGKQIQAELIIGEAQIGQSLVDLINEQHSDAIIRNTGIRSFGSYEEVSDNWRRSREALGDFLSKNPGGLVKRIEYVGSNKYLEEAKQSDQRLAGNRKIERVYNAKVKFKRTNPLLFHAIIGQREAIIALPKNSGQSSGSNMAILVRDKILVDALRVWYDEVLWDGGEQSQVIDFSKYDESFEAVKKMYGYTD